MLMEYKCKSCKGKVAWVDESGICDSCCPVCWDYLEPDSWCADCRTYRYFEERIE